MNEFVAIAATVTALVGAPFSMVWFGQARAQAAQPFGFFRVVLLVSVACAFVVWAAMAFTATEGHLALQAWSSADSLRWVAAVLLAYVLSGLVPALAGYAVAVKLSRRGALLSALGLGALNAALYSVTFVAVSCAVLFAC
ncbi:hypothetical protein [Ramlibacter sp. WS9]|uniref:hypothetical protein n=1 Tax=Ramlibacter sp. WS9 TaxID=1882741 RepID=UPI0011424623|nr:hypothetical protein [Ramlibacter sp. WS9]ROZ61528.1 hypothetical protein EEB15_32525 [Ramlibacter sp. WS9]